MKAGTMEFPTGHQPGMAVPKGGSSCANCEHLGADRKTCTSSYFIAWHRSNRLPYPPDEYSSDWWTPAEVSRHQRVINRFQERQNA